MRSSAQQSLSTSLSSRRAKSRWSRTCSRPPLANPAQLAATHDKGKVQSAAHKNQRYRAAGAQGDFGVLPTFVAVSSISAANVATTLIGFVVFYTALAIVDVFLMLRAIKMGPEEFSGSRGGAPVMIPAE